MKCIICERRPARVDGQCFECQKRIEADRQKKNGNKPEKYLTYQGHVVGLYDTGNGTYRAQLLQRKAEGLPKGKTLDLNNYVEGFDRNQIKRFKACVRKLAHA